MKTRKLTLAAMLVAIGVSLGNILYIPVGVSKCFFVQHTINIIGAVCLGPFYNVLMAFSISLVRNLMGTGSLLAFPGSMIGALLAGLVYKYSRNKYLTGVGEVLGTGVLGGLLAFPIAKLAMGKEVGGLFFVYPFLISTVGGSLLGLVLLRMIDFRKLLGEVNMN